MVWDVEGFLASMDKSGTSFLQEDGRSPCMVRDHSRGAYMEAIELRIK